MAPIKMGRRSRGVEQQTFTCDCKRVLDKGEVKAHIHEHPTHVINERRVEHVRWFSLAHCIHPLTERGKSMLGDPETTAYCNDCQCVLYLEGGEWVAQPTGISSIRTTKR